ncbi:YbjN domain-containing protein [Sanguibacter suaedae]|uniref:YbjN domain-containing protein n=1 Tax=Sanguibacter suaedae TaxID=2795737 RepID=A0A934MAC8_9MICO|nr:YbjN domain-containing protein [Sanguibacter suaedae]MBI9115495.1 YbjN domain-containing protein [Sanguibacter suaedae]
MGSPALTPAQPQTVVALTPLTRDRIEEFLTANDWSYGIDPDGDIGGQWDDNLFYFFVMGDAEEVLQVRGRWKHSFPSSRAVEFAVLLNEFNRDVIWPKLYARAEETGELGIYSEVSTDLEHGVSDDQLGQLLSCGLFTSLRAFESLAARLGIPEG